MRGNVHGQTQQRIEFDQLNNIANQKTAQIQDYTNSIATMQHQIGQMDASITGLKDTVTTNEQTIVGQRRDLNQMERKAERGAHQ